MRKLTLTILLALLFAFGLTACGGGDEEAADGGGDSSTSSVGDAARGEELFNQNPIGAAGAPGCGTCHSLEPGVVIVGPSQSDVGARAETAVEGMSAEEYLRESIVDPEAHLAEGFGSGLMHPTYGEDLTNSQINDLVAFLLTLK
ncbi:c-type cytochrome [Candidatus Leptofilum sp.]|uniref:c-type cytochrome n=1 Tax=Candidatus Leptofilum sp. TaxID=3241576 RepID=UPI003B59B79F